MKLVDVREDYKLLILRSKAFENNCEIPRKYTCEGVNVNPPLQIDGIPAKAKSLVLIVDDPDAPGGTWVHWVVWNIPPTHQINEDEVPGVQGINDFGVNLYGGPCPPSGTHNYHFRVYALNALLDLPEGSSRHDVELAMDNHIIGYGELVGVYHKKSTPSDAIRTVT
jgi:Raf kinase inhibitor-like YbhB/YbcL family protein